MSISFCPTNACIAVRIRLTIPLSFACSLISKAFSKAFAKFPKALPCHLTPQASNTSFDALTLVNRRCAPASSTAQSLPSFSSCSITCKAETSPNESTCSDLCSTGDGRFIASGLSLPSRTATVFSSIGNAVEGDSGEISRLLAASVVDAWFNGGAVSCRAARSKLIGAKRTSSVMVGGFNKSPKRIS